MGRFGILVALAAATTLAGATPASAGCGLDRPSQSVGCERGLTVAGTSARVECGTEGVLNVEFASAWYSNTPGQGGCGAIAGDSWVETGHCTREQSGGFTVETSDHCRRGHALPKHSSSEECRWTGEYSPSVSRETETCTESSSSLGTQSTSTCERIDHRSSAGDSYEETCTSSARTRTPVESSDGQCVEYRSSHNGTTTECHTRYDYAGGTYTETCYNDVCETRLAGRRLPAL